MIKCDACLSGCDRLFVSNLLRHLKPTITHALPMAMLLQSQTCFRPSLLCSNQSYMERIWDTTSRSRTTQSIHAGSVSCSHSFLTRSAVIRASLEDDADPLLHHRETSKDIPDNYESREVNVRKEENKNSIMAKLRRYGVAGILSYGLLNTVYYLGMFLVAWFYISPVSGGLGYRAAAERFIKLFALVWAGSQVTKIPRGGCALALAPVIDRGLTWFTHHYEFKSRGQAFGAIVASCVGLALVVFAILTFLWA